MGYSFLTQFRFKSRYLGGILSLFCSSLRFYSCLIMPPFYFFFYILHMSLLCGLAVSSHLTHLLTHALMFFFSLCIYLVELYVTLLCVTGSVEEYGWEEECILLYVVIVVVGDGVLLCTLRERRV